METIIKVRPSELNETLLEKLKSLLEAGTMLM